MSAPPDPLSSLLSEWRHTPAPAPNFDTRVHELLATPPPRSGLLARLRDFFALPSSPALRFASALALLFAITAGVQTGLQSQRAKAFDRGADHYVYTIDPLLQIRSAAATPHRHP